MHGFGKSDVGKVRASNEDAFYVNNEGPAPLANLFVVADGMGGHNAGDVASRKAIFAFCEYIAAHNYFIYTEQYLADALLYANGHVHDEACHNPAMAGMGTTFSTVTTDSDNLYFAHVGDSRIYAITDNGIMQLTRDHSLVAEMAERGMITPEEALHHPEKNVITRAVGTDAHVNVDKGFYPLANVKYVLMCSDGLTNMVSDAEIFDVLKAENSITNKVDILIAKANEGGGDDNISVIVMGWDNI
ncbi:MAG: Stp1/IreP family PP2C-type Ser/Thr phosphatase [Clostridiales bacterium]|jgi:protein phosphatase|nr:Stp1/IreP family PP2C-type Ser/Thr phosphatase [Clostridiales bacterium]